ncbi:hypothetical protein [Demequina flava]|uniref:hypothetical protein n=1 Tax=Demequina flava TaxID=1095025 RepID=UPI0007862DEB|nr:hypothetical protein [Demequina flava]
MTESAGKMPHPWHRFAPDSIEVRMLTDLAATLKVPLEPRALKLPSGVRAEVDGAASDDSVLVKVVATQGTVRSAHRNRVLADMLKLTWLRAAVAPKARLVLCITEPVAPYFSATSWPAQAAHDLGVDIYVHGTDGTRRLHAEQELDDTQI